MGVVRRVATRIGTYWRVLARGDQVVRSAVSGDRRLKVSLLTFDSPQSCVNDQSFSANGSLSSGGRAISSTSSAVGSAPGSVPVKGGTSSGEGR